MFNFHDPLTELAAMIAEGVGPTPEKIKEAEEEARLVQAAQDVIMTTLGQSPTETCPSKELYQACAACLEPKLGRSHCLGAIWKLVGEHKICLNTDLSFSISPLLLFTPLSWPRTIAGGSHCQPTGS